MSGHLPTGRVITESSFVTNANSVPLYTSLGYDSETSRGESFSSLLQFTTAAAGTTLQGPAWWGAESDRRVEFTAIIQSRGTKWTPISTKVPFTTMPRVLITAVHPFLPNALTGIATFVNGGRLSVPLSDGATLVMTPSSATGRFTGALTLPASNGLPLRTLTVQGITDQRSSILTGYFIDRDGAIGDFQAAPPIR
jgi:hypothetical protein